MIQLVQQWVSLLAASSNGQVWGRFDHQRPAYDSEQLLMIVTLAVVAVTIGLLLVRLRSNFQTDSWRALFSELCRAHGLSGSSRRLLKRLAAARGLRNPAILFVEPGHFELSNIPHSLQHAGKELQLLRERLFA